MSEERRFVYGFRVSHCALGITCYLAVVGLGVWKAERATSSFSQVIGIAMAAAFAYMTITMIGWLIVRQQGRRHVVVGATAVSAPPVPRWRVADVVIPYADIRGLAVSSAGKGTLRIQHAAGTLEIARAMLGTDAEFDELVRLLKERAPASR